MLQITPGERIALRLLAQGVSLSEMAGRIGLTASELDPYLSALFAKMGVASRAEAIASALRRGLVIADETTRCRALVVS